MIFTDAERRLLMLFCTDDGDCSMHNGNCLGMAVLYV